MNTPRIQTDDRGITINKTLAYTMLVGFVAMGMYLGRTEASFQGRLAPLERGVATNSDRIEGLSRQLNPLITTTQVLDARLMDIYRGIERIESRIEMQQDSAAQRQEERDAMRREFERDQLP